MLTTVNHSTVRNTVRGCCEHGTITYEVSVSGHAGAGAMANAGDNTAMIDNVVLSPVTSSLTPPSGCVASGPASLVSGQSGSFSVTCSAGSTPLSYAWSRTPTGFTSTTQGFNDTPFSSATTTVASATYSVNVSNAAGNQVVNVTIANGSFIGPPPTTATETLTFFHPHINGSPLMATDVAGNVAWREDYSAFGERKRLETNANAGAAANQNWFIGKPQDTQTGFVYFGARWYDPVVGRFLSFDPAGVDEANLHSFNRYAYGNNNPNKYLDPDGRQVVQIAVAAGGLYLAGSMMAPQAGKGDGVMAGGTPPAPSPQIMGTPNDGPKSPQIMSNPIQAMNALITFTPISLAGWMSHIITRSLNDPLPRDKNGLPIPETSLPHSQLGTESGSKGPYRSAREFGADGKPVRDIHFTDHGRPQNHTNPHQHKFEGNKTGGTPKYGPPEPLKE